MTFYSAILVVGDHNSLEHLQDILWIKQGILSFINVNIKLYLQCSGQTKETVTRVPDCQ